MRIKKMRFGLLMFAVTTFAFGETANEMAHETLWDKLHAIHSMKATFTQKIYANKRLLTDSSGEMALERPSYFRWQTKSPMEQLLVADGEKFWLYDVDLEQVTVRSQTALEGAAAGLFLGDDKARFLNDFSVSKAQENQQAVFRLTATEKHANIQRMTLRFDGDFLVGMDLYDQLEQRTMIRFKQVKNNIKLSSKLFHFLPPKGVDVVKQ